MGDNMTDNMESMLIKKARSVAGKFALDGFEGNSAGDVGAALITRDGNVYTGICIDVACSLGFCAEHAAIAEMLKHRETRVEMIVAVRKDGVVLPPCGRCREMLLQIHSGNAETKVIVSEDKVLTLAELMPYRWAIV
jgi:cytidine deaminase